MTHMVNFDMRTPQKEKIVSSSSMYEYAARESVALPFSSVSSSDHLKLALSSNMGNNHTAFVCSIFVVKFILVGRST